MQRNISNSEKVKEMAKEVDTWWPVPEAFLAPDVAPNWSLEYAMTSSAGWIVMLTSGSKYFLLQNWPSPWLSACYIFLVSATW